MAKYEHKILDVNKAVAETEADKLGDKGWEMVASHMDDASLPVRMIMTFKRKKVAKKDKQLLNG